MTRKVLVITGDADAFAPLSRAMTRAGFEFVFAPARKRQIRKALDAAPECVLLDLVSLNGDEGALAYAFLKERAAILPLIVFAVRKSDFKGWDADAFISPPLTWRKLSYKLKRLPYDRRYLTVGGITLDLFRRVLIRGGSEFKLTPKVAALLEYFMRNQGRVISRKELMEAVWETNYVDDTRTLDVHVHWLRKALGEDSASPVYLRTVKGVGYRFDVPQERDLG